VLMALCPYTRSSTELCWSPFHQRFRPACTTRVLRLRMHWFESQENTPPITLCKLYLTIQKTKLFQNSLSRQNVEWLLLNGEGLKQELSNELLLFTLSSHLSLGESQLK
jgi:hypothetical protein